MTAGSVRAAEGVIAAAMKRGGGSPAALADALECAGLLFDPERADELAAAGREQGYAEALAAAADAPVPFVPTDQAYRALAPEPPEEPPAEVVARQLAGLDDVVSVTAEAPDVVCVTIRPCDLDSWAWWLGRFQVPVESITSRGSSTTAKGTAAGGVRVAILAHGIARLQAARMSHIVRQRGANRG